MTNLSPAIDGKVHEQYDATDSDLVLVSSDNVKFKVHKANLSVHSVVFRSMLQTGSSSTHQADEVPMSESSDLLGRMLPFCYETRVPSIDCSLPNFWELVKAFDKYEIGRGLDAMAATCGMRALENPLDAVAVVRYYLLAALCSPGDVNRSVKLIIQSELPWESISPVMKEGYVAGVGGDGKLMSLLFRRLSILSQKRSSELMRTWERSLYAQSGSHVGNKFADALRLWSGSASCTTRASVERYLVGKTCSLTSPPWDALKQVLDELPIKLE